MWETASQWLYLSRPAEDLVTGARDVAGGNSEDDAHGASSLDDGAPRETSCLSISVYSAVVIAVICGFLVLGRDYIKYLLLSLEETNLWLSLAIFSFLFTIVSFPMTWGYILLNIAAGYLYGLLLGLAVVMTCALLGVSTAHVVIRTCLRNFVMARLNNRSVRAVMAVVESDNGFKVVVLSRLTPIPFGLQNALYAVSNIIAHSRLTPIPFGLQNALYAVSNIIAHSRLTPIPFGLQNALYTVNNIIAHS